MKAKKVKIVGAVIFVAISAGVYISLDDVDLQEGVPEAQKPYERDLAEQYILGTGNKKIRVRRGIVASDAVVEDSEVGRAVLATITDNVECNVVLEGEAIAGTDLYGVDGPNRSVPDLPDIKDIMGKASWPEPLYRTCDGTPKKCMWCALFKGNDCVTVADSSGYVVSSMEETLKLSTSVKRKLLLQQGICVNSNSITITCWVPFGDPRAIVDGEVRIPCTWGTGVNKLNFSRAKNGKTKKKYKDTDYKTE